MPDGRDQYKVTFQLIKLENSSNLPNMNFLENDEKDYGKFGPQSNTKHIFTYHWIPRKKAALNYCLYFRYYDYELNTITGHNSSGSYK